MSEVRAPTAISTGQRALSLIIKDIQDEITTSQVHLEQDISAIDPKELSITNVSINELLQRAEQSMASYTAKVEVFEAKTKEQRETKTKWEEELLGWRETIEKGFSTLHKLKKVEMRVGGASNKHTPDAAMTSITQMLAETQSATQGLLQKLVDDKPPTMQNVKLPNLELPTFNGNIMAYQEFHDLFTATIHSNMSLSPVQKFGYLKKYLSGKPLELISGLKVCDSNYSVARDLIHDRYGNKQRSIDAHYSAMMAIPPCISETGSLRNCINTLEVHLRSLEAQGENVSQSIFVPLVLSKLPHDIKLQLELSTDSEWTMPTLRKALNRLLNAKEKAEGPLTSTQSSPPAKKYLATGQSLVAGAQAARQIKCMYCGYKHYTDECRKFKSLEERRAQLGSKCFICLKPGHNAKACSNARACYHCKKRTHHRSLCPTKFGSHSNAKGASLNADAESFIPETHAVLADGDCKRVLMQTAVTNLTSPDGSKSIPVRILFDTGSSRSYINQSVSDKLGLGHERVEEISVATFGSTKRVTKKFPIVQANVTLKSGGKENVSLNVTDNITCPLLKLPMKQHESQVKLPLAEPLCESPEQMKIDVLLGADQYY